MPQVRIQRNVYESGALKYAADTEYAESEDTLRQVALGNGVLVEPEPEEDPSDETAEESGETAQATHRRRGRKAAADSK